MAVLSAIHQTITDKEHRNTYQYCALVSEISALCGLNEEVLRK
ncbi:hypothetical protein [Petrimonas sulfuriphila]